MPKWIVYATVAMVSFAAWSLIANNALDDLSPYLAAQIRLTSGDSHDDAKVVANQTAPYLVQALSAIGLVPFAMLLLFSKKLRHASNLRRGVFFALTCGIFSAVGNLLLYRSLAENGPAGLVYPLTGTPLLSVVAAPLLFKERISRTQIAGVALAIAAIGLLNTDPTSHKGAHIVAPWMSFALLALLCYSIAMTAQKAATYHISDELATLAYAAGFLIVGACLLAKERVLVDAFPSIPLREMVPSILIGAFMGFGTLTLYAAYRYGKATIVTPYVLMYPLVTVLVCVAFYGERLDLPRGMGVICALCSSALLGVERAQPPLSGSQIKAS